MKKNSIVCLILVGILLSPFLLIRPATAEEPWYQNISVHDAKQMIENTPNVVIIDVRNQSEYDLGHLYGAQLIPLNALENRTIPVEIAQPSTNDTFMFSVYQQIMTSFNLSAHINDPVIVYCKAGSRSAPACELLAEHGFTQVYNMIGGITEWMQAGYPIYTPYHHVSVDVTDGETTTDIKPWLLYTSTCTTCQNQSETCSTTTSPLNSTDTIIQQSENYTLILTTVEINGTIQEYLTEKTLLWQQNETAPGFNRTMALTSIITTSQNITTQAYSIYDQVQHNDYFILISTLLNTFR